MARAPLPSGFDVLQWAALDGPPADIPWQSTPEQVLYSSAGRPWHGLFVWHQIGPAGDLYIPPQHSHGILLRRSTTPTLLEYRCGPRVADTLWRRGDALVARAGLPSFWRSSDLRDNVHIALDPSWLVRASGGEAIVCNVQCRRDPVLTAFADLLLASLETPTSMRPSFAEHAALGIAIHLLENYTDHVPAAGSLTRRQMDTVAQALAEGLDQKWPLARLAELVGLSPFHFARSFKVSFGMPPHAYVCARRMEAAARLLRGTRKTIEQIAAATGYASAPHFAQIFRRHWGISPMVYRRGH